MNDLINTKLISLLICFTRPEWRSLRDFLVSGIAGPTGKSVAFYDLLSEHHPDFNHKNLTREKVFQGLFDEPVYEDKKLRYAMTDLFRQATMFLKYRALELHSADGRHLLITELARRGADKAFLSEYKSDAVNPSGDADHYYNRYREDFIYLNHFYPRQKRTVDNPIADVARNLDVFFVTRKLQLLCEIVNVRNVMSVEYDFILQNQILETIRKGAFRDVPVIVIYYNIFMTLTEPENENHFEELKQHLSAHNNLFKREELRDMYQYLMNYCIKKINQGNTDYVKRLFEIYKSVLPGKILFSGENLSQWDYKNIVVIGLRAGEQEWVKYFIEEFKNSLPGAERENAYVYNLAYYYFTVADFRKTLTLLQQVEFTDLYYQLDMRAILLKCYFEMDDMETFLYHAAAFRIFLSRNKLIPDYQRTIYRNMIKFTTRLMKSDGSKKQLDLLSSEIENTKQIADINWLRKKVISH